MSEKDSGLVWDCTTDSGFAFDLAQKGPVALGWDKWATGGTDREWNVVPDHQKGKYVQEVKKQGVQTGLYRQNRGFKVGDTYRVSFEVNFTSGGGTAQAAVGIHPTGGSEFSEVVVGPFTPLSKNNWIEVAYEFQASNWAQTIFLVVDLRGAQDGAVSLDQVKVELLSERPPEPWMLDGRPPVEPPFIYGMHDPGAEHLFNQKQRHGWVVHALEIGANPADQSGKRFSEWVDGHGVIARIANLNGQTIPAQPEQFDDFAQRCANFVQHSVGAGIWSIGNEPPLERAPDPVLYARCYHKCRLAIKAVRPGAQVITAGMVQGNPDYFRHVIDEIQRLADGDPQGGVDGFAIHSYTNSLEWKPDNFGLYAILMAQIPTSLQHLPVYMTEAGSGAAGTYPENQNLGFVNNLFKHVHEWNQKPGTQKIRSVNFYRWQWHPPKDIWGIEHKPGMIADFLAALEPEYCWTTP
jgi:hypothetical protein